jgi:hypothetical protein
MHFTACIHKKAKMYFYKYFLINMKKQRGLKRYYKNLERQNEFKKLTELKLDDPDSWLPNWHLHFNWKGYGNYSFKKRKPHLDKLFRHLQLLVEKTKSLKSDFQLYAIILDFNSASDALFLHKPSSCNTQFPFKVEALSKETTLLNKDLNSYLNKLEGYEKLYGQADQAFCLLYIQNVEKPFKLEHSFY